MTGKIVKYNYKNIIKIKYWEHYLGRKLEKEEFLILKQTESENRMNEKILDIYELAKLNGLYVPQLTNMHGNCIFESLQYHGICDDIDEFRCGLAFMMIMFKDKKGFLPSFKNETMEEIFNQFSEESVVFCRKKRRLYKYNFVAMCIDLATNSSWTRINTNLILLALSVILNLKIIILHNNGHLSTIEIEGNKVSKTIYIGLIDEIHYFPLAERNGHVIENVCPKYVDSLKLFHQWAQGMAIMTGNVVYEHE